MAEQESKSLYKGSYEQLAQMVQQRQSKDKLSSEVQILLRPELPPWGDWGNSKSGNKGNIEVYSSAPQEATEICADGLQGYLASKGTAWFNYEMVAKELNEDKKTRDWLQHRADVTYRLYADSNYYSHLNPCLLNGITFGDAPTWMEKNNEENGIACRNFYPRNVWISRDITGAVKRFVYGHFQMTVLEAADLFNTDDLSQALIDDFTHGRLLNKYKFSQFVVMRTDPLVKNEKEIPEHPWISYYCQDDVPETEQKILIPKHSGMGYWTQPFSYWREREVVGLPYGWGRGCSAIISVYGVNEAAKQLLTAGNLAIDPALLVPYGMKSRIDIAPRGRTYLGKANQRPEVFNRGEGFPFGADIHDRLRDECYRWFDVPFFTQLRNSERQMTAYEIAKRIEETGVLLEPKTGRFETDKLDQDHERAFDLGDQMELADPPPPILVQKIEELQRHSPGRKDLGRINVVYNGRLVQAMRLAKQSVQVDFMVNQIGALAREQKQAGYLHTVWDNFNVDEFGRYAGRNVDLPENIIKDDEDIERTRADREKAVAAQQQQQMALEMAKAVPSLQGATNENSPLAALAGAEK